MLGRANDGGPRARNGPARAAGRPALPARTGWAPRTRFGALAAREARYWWRDARRRANLITFSGRRRLPAGLRQPRRPVPRGAQPRGRLTDQVACSLVFVGALASRHAGQPVRLRRQRLCGQRGRRRAGPRRAGRAHGRLLPVRHPDAARSSRWRSSPVLGKPEWFRVAARQRSPRRTARAWRSACSISVLGAYSLPETSNPFALGIRHRAGQGPAELRRADRHLALGVPFSRRHRVPRRRLAVARAAGRPRRTAGRRGARHVHRRGRARPPDAGAAADRDAPPLNSRGGSATGRRRQVCGVQTRARRRASRGGRHGH